jgi:hypothetical protein
MSEHDDFVENCKKRASADRDEMGESKECVAGPEKLVDTNEQVHALFAGIRVAQYLASQAADLAVGHVESKYEYELVDLACVLAEQLAVLSDLVDTLHDSL